MDTSVAAAHPESGAVPMARLAGFPELVRLWDHYRPALLLYCLRLLEGNRADAEDALGSVVLKLLDRRIGEETVRDPLALFHRLLFTACMDIHRRRRREILQPPRVASEPPGDGACDESAEQAYLRRELCDQVSSGLDALPGRLRVVLLQRMDDTPYPDIARAHGISIENARKQVQLARDLLRSQLGHPERIR